MTIASMERNNRILLVEDTEDFRSFLASQLHLRHFQVLELGDGLAARAALERDSFDIIVLDMNLPGLDGVEILKWLRLHDAESTVIMISASGEEVDRVLCLELGADDFLVKPFSARELQARIRAVSRRRRPRSVEDNTPASGRAAETETRQALPGRSSAGATPASVPGSVPRSAPPPALPSALPSHAPPLLDIAGTDALLAAGEVRLDPERQRCEVAGSEVVLTSLEFRLLHWFMRHPQRVFNRAQLLQAVWGREYPGYEKAVNNHILRLRRKIGDDPDQPRHIQTVHGSGYRFEP